MGRIQGGELLIPLLVPFIAIPSFGGIHPCLVPPGDGRTASHKVLPLLSRGRPVTQTRQDNLNPNEKHGGRGAGERASDGHILERWSTNSTRGEEVGQNPGLRLPGLSSDAPNLKVISFRTASQKAQKPPGKKHPQEMRAPSLSGFAEAWPVCPNNHLHLHFYSAELCRVSFCGLKLKNPSLLVWSF